MRLRPHGEAADEGGTGRDDGGSGGSGGRRPGVYHNAGPVGEGLARLIEEAEAGGVSVVVTEDRTRLGRDGEAERRLRAAGAIIVECGERPASGGVSAWSGLTTEVAEQAARQERAVRSERAKAAWRRRKERQ